MTIFVNISLPDYAVATTGTQQNVETLENSFKNVRRFTLPQMCPWTVCWIFVVRFMCNLVKFPMLTIRDSIFFCFTVFVHAFDSPILLFWWTNIYLVYRAYVVKYLYWRRVTSFHFCRAQLYHPSVRRKPVLREEKCSKHRTIFTVGVVHGLKHCWCQLSYPKNQEIPLERTSNKAGVRKSGGNTFSKR